jgi:hypothetical protein
MTDEISSARVKVALAGMVVAPLLIVVGLLWPALGGPYLLGIPFLFGAALLIQLSGAPAARFVVARPSTADEPDWYVALTPTYFIWASAIAQLPNRLVKGATWLAWSAPAGLFGFLVVHAAIDFITHPGG